MDPLSQGGTTLGISFSSLFRSVVATVTAVFIGACSSQSLAQKSINAAEVAVALAEFENSYQHTSGLLMAHKHLLSPQEWQTLVAVNTATNRVYRSARGLLSESPGLYRVKSLALLAQATGELRYYYSLSYSQLLPKLGSFPEVLQGQLRDFHRNMQHLERSYAELLGPSSAKAKSVSNILTIAARGLAVFGVSHETDHSTRY